MLDSGSQSSFMAKNLFKRLNIKPAKIIFASSNTKYKREITVFITQSISGAMSHTYVDKERLDIPNNIQPADPK